MACFKRMVFTDTFFLRNPIFSNCRRACRLVRSVTWKAASTGAWPMWRRKAPFSNVSAVQGSYILGGNDTFRSVFPDRHLTHSLNRNNNNIKLSKVTLSTRRLLLEPAKPTWSLCKKRLVQWPSLQLNTKPLQMPNCLL